MINYFQIGMLEPDRFHSLAQTMDRAKILPDGGERVSQVVRILLWCLWCFCAGGKVRVHTLIAPWREIGFCAREVVVHQPGVEKVVRSVQKGCLGLSVRLSRDFVWMAAAGVGNLFRLAVFGLDIPGYDLPVPSLLRPDHGDRVTLALRWLQLEDRTVVASILA